MFLRNKYHLIKCFFYLFFVFILFSCDRTKVYDNYKKIEGAKWAISDFKKFDVEVTDTLSLQKFYFNVRHTGEYKYSNLYLFITTSFPDNKRARDTAQLILSDKEGRWLGTGTGNIKNMRLLFKKGFRFTSKGVYSFTIEHGMRDQFLQGITDIGIRIEKQ